MKGNPTNSSNLPSKTNASHNNNNEDSHCDDNLKTEFNTDFDDDYECYDDHYDNNNDYIRNDNNNDSLTKEHRTTRQSDCNFDPSKLFPKDPSIFCEINNIMSNKENEEEKKIIEWTFIKIIHC